MPGTNGGTGRPLWFRCSACRKKYSHDEYHRRIPKQHGFRSDVELTGVTRALNDGRASGRNTKVLRQYRCKHCGHVWFSRHVDLEPRNP